MAEPYPVVPRRLATEDLREAAAWYATEVDSETARRFIDATEQAFSRIGGQPGLGSPRYAVELDWPGLRTHPLERFPDLIFYVEQTDHLDVLRVLHAHRDVPTSLQDPAPGGDEVTAHRRPLRSVTSPDVIARQKSSVDRSCNQRRTVMPSTTRAGQSRGYELGGSDGVRAHHRRARQARG